MIEEIENLKIDYPIVIMHDFIIDNIVKLRSKEELISAISEDKEPRSVRKMSINQTKGGKAVNIAYALLKMGASDVTLFTIADEIGFSLLQYYFRDYKDKINFRIKEGKQGYNIALELLDKGEKIFLCDVKDNGKLGPETLFIDEREKDKLRHAAAVVLADWTSNSLGTELAEYAFANSPNALHLIDTGDVTSRKNELPQLLNALTKSENVVLSMNESECDSFAMSIGMTSLSDVIKNKDMGNDENNLEEKVYEKEIKEYFKSFAKRTRISLDLHGKRFSAWSDGNDFAYDKTMKITLKSLTGAGDYWDAANIVGYLASLTAKERLSFANAYVSLFLTNPYSEPATMEEVITLIKEKE